MKTVDLRRALLATVSLVLAVGGGAAADASAAPGAPAHAAPGDPVAAAFDAVTRDTKWTLVNRLKLPFPTYHTEGLAFAGDRMFLSAVQILEPTQKYPTPQGGYDRTPGKGIGHVFVLDREGHLQRDIILGEGDMYHPAGMDFDGTSVWVPVAQYRPNSSAIIYRIDARTLGVHKQFEVTDHVGGIVRDTATGHLVGQSWGSRRIYEWTPDGRQIAAWDNPGFFVDYQDCQTLPRRRMICGGIANLPQAPTAGGAGATYELGGIGLIDLRGRRIEHEVPGPLWSAANHVVTRNPFKIAAEDTTLTMWVAPDNGDEGNGTELLAYSTTVTPPR